MPDMGRPPVLLLHGALGSAATMAPLAERLARDFTVHGLDFAGHGVAPAPAHDLSVEAMAEQVASYVTSHGMAPARLFGYSMGGYVALWLAATKPHLVSRVMTLGTKLAWSREVAERERAMLDPSQIRAKVPKFADALAARHTGMDWESLCWMTSDLLGELGANPRITPAVLGTIHCPVRLMVGDRDTTVSVGETLGAVRELPAGELEVLPATPHPLERVNLDRLAWTISGFLRSKT